MQYLKFYNYQVMLVQTDPPVTVWSGFFSLHYFILTYYKNRQPIFLSMQILKHFMSFETVFQSSSVCPGTYYVIDCVLPLHSKGLGHKCTSWWCLRKLGSYARYLLLVNIKIAPKGVPQSKRDARCHFS